MEAIILAGGLGTRLQSVVKNIPKPMAPIGEKPFLALLLDYWARQGVNHFILSVGYRHEVIKDYFGDSYHGADISYAVEKEPLGTGGGILLAQKHLRVNKPFLIINGDTYFAVDLEKLNSFHKTHHASVSMALYRMNENTRYGGVDVDSHDHIRKLIPKGEALGMKKALINGGVQLVSPGVLEKCGRKAGDRLSLEEDIFEVLMKNKISHCGFESRGIFIDIGLPEDFARAQSLIK